MFKVGAIGFASGLRYVMSPSSSCRICGSICARSPTAITFIVSGFRNFWATDWTSAAVMFAMRPGRPE